MRIASLIGGRPNLIKVGALHETFVKTGLDHILIDIGVFRRHYGPASFAELGLPRPDLLLEMHDDRHWNYLDHLKWLAPRLADAFTHFRPSVVLVYGDITQGVAAAYAAAHSSFTCAHVEAGLRNNDLQDTEELNRLLIDRFSNLLLAPCNEARSNLVDEAIPENQVYVVGNTVIGSIRRLIPRARNEVIGILGLSDTQYGLVTIHRHENIDSSLRLRSIVEGLERISLHIPLVFIQYDSTSNALARNGLYSRLDNSEQIKMIKTLPYLDYLGLLRGASIVVTDSSGIQDEATYLGIPCVICRDTTHRAGVLRYGNNLLVGTNPDNIQQVTLRVLQDNYVSKSPLYPPEWDLDVGTEITKVLGGLE